MTASEFRAVNLRHNVGWLLGLEPREMDLVFAAAKSRRFPARSVITFQGDPADRFLLMWEGRARYFFETPSGKKVILMWIAPGDIFGAAALVSRPSTYLTSTEAVRESVVLVWERSAVRALARRFPQLLLFAMDYFRWYVAAHAALISQTARERLAHVLLGLAQSIGQKASGGVEIDVTNEELANLANITPYTTSRMISNWQQKWRDSQAPGKNPSPLS